MEVGSLQHVPAALPPEEEPVPIVQETGWAPGPIWTDAENLIPTGNRFSDSPAHRIQNCCLFKI